MRVLVWNIAHNARMWGLLDALREQEQFEVALLQEAVPPADGDGTRRVVPPVEDGAGWSTELFGYPRPWRTAVASWTDGVRVEPIESRPIAGVKEDDRSCLPESYPGAFTAVRANGVVLVSFYGVWEHLAEDLKSSYSIASVHRTISDLTRLWFGRRDPRVVIAGDWNVWHAYGNAPRWEVRQWSARSDTVFDRLAAEGFTLMGPFGDKRLDNCPCDPAAECRHVRTYWHQHRDEGTAYQTDYVAATPAAGVSSCRVVTHLGGEPLWRVGYSDHVPILFDVWEEFGVAR